MRNEANDGRMRRLGRGPLGTLGALLLLCVLSAARAQAAASDSLTVTVVPNIVYAVDIDTASPGQLQLGVVDQGASTFTVKGIPVEVQSSINQTDLTIQAQVVSGGWSIDGSTDAMETDGLQAWAVFTDTSVADVSEVQGLAGAFDAEDVLQVTPQHVGQVGASPLRHTVAPGAAGFKSMERIPSFRVDGPGSRSHLWLKFTLPRVTSVEDEQRIYITITAGPTN